MELNPVVSLAPKIVEVLERLERDATQCIAFRWVQGSQKLAQESWKSAIGHNVSQTISLNVGGSNEVKMGLNSFGTEIPKPDQCF